MYLDSSIFALFIYFDFTTFNWAMAPVEYATTTLAVSWTGTILGLLVYSLRFVNNWRFLHRFSWDFYLTSLTLVRCINIKHPSFPYK